MTADVLGSAGDRAALMLADRRHVGHACDNHPRGICAHCRDSWPCDARRALDACNALIEQLDAAIEHAQTDCAALGRVWHLARMWDQRADSSPATPLTSTILAGYAQTVRNAITDPGPLVCRHCGARLVPSGPLPDWAAVGVPAYPVLFCPGRGDEFPLHEPREDDPR